MKKIIFAVAMVFIFAGIGLVLSQPTEPTKSSGDGSSKSVPGAEIAMGLMGARGAILTATSENPWTFFPGGLGSFAATKACYNEIGNGILPTIFGVFFTATGVAPAGDVLCDGASIVTNWGGGILKGVFRVGGSKPSGPTTGGPSEPTIGPGGPGTFADYCGDDKVTPPEVCDPPGSNYGNCMCGGITYGACGANTFIGECDEGCKTFTCDPPTAPTVPTKFCKGPEDCKATPYDGDCIAINNYYPENPCMKDCGYCFYPDKPKT